MALSSADLPTMYMLLRNSLSGDVSVRKPAETALLESENRPGFCSCLLVVFLTIFLCICFCFCLFV